MYYMVFDVESNGLHGQGFSVGWVVVDEHGAELDSGYARCSMVGVYDLWVSENVLPALSDLTHLQPHNMRSWFWAKWLEWKYKGALLYADCPWPVEARFLAACVDDAPQEREWQGPYPLMGIET